MYVRKKRKDEEIKDYDETEEGDKNYSDEESEFFVNPDEEDYAEVVKGQYKKEDYDEVN